MLSIESGGSSDFVERGERESSEAGGGGRAFETGRVCWPAEEDPVPDLTVLMVSLEPRFRNVATLDVEAELDVFLWSKSMCGLGLIVIVLAVLGGRFSESWGSVIGSSDFGAFRG